MPTFGALKAKIANDLLTGAAVIDDEINDAVLAAIDAYEAKRFWFNESRTITFPTIVGESDYSDPDLWGRIITADWLTTTVALDEHRMYYQTPSEVDYLLHKAAGATNAQPYIWTTFGGILRIYPRPNAVYPIRVTGLITWPVLVNVADSNVWTNEGYELIRARAKWDLALNVTKDDGEVGRMAMAEERALDGLMTETGRRAARGYVEPVCF